MLHDITALQQAALRSREELEQLVRYQEHILQYISDGVIIIDLEGTITSWNNAAQQIFGYSAQEVVGRPITLLYLGQHTETLGHSLAQILDGNDYIGQWQGQCKDGRATWVEVKTTLLYDMQGNALGFICIIKDINERIQAEIAQQISEARMRCLMDANLIGVIISDQTHIIEANDAFLLMMGYSREEVRQRKLSWLDATPVEYAQLDQKREQDLRLYKKSTPYEKEYIRKDGTRICVLIGAALLQEEPLQWVSFIIDISAQKQLEENLRRQEQALKEAALEARRSEERLHLLIENIADVITIFQADGTITFQSASIEQILGWQPEERIGQNIWQHSIVHPADEQVHQTFFRELQLHPEKTIFGTFRLQHKDGSYRFIEAIGKNLLENAVLQGIITTYRDITERMELELRKDEFISVASHELRTPVTTLKGHAQVLKMLLEEQHLQDAEVFEYLDIIDHQINKLTRLITDFLDISRIKAGILDYKDETFDFDSFLHSTIKMLQPVYPTHVLKVSGSSQAIVSGDTDRLGQVLINLVNNAVKYSPHASTIDITVGQTEEGVIVRIRDYGSGITGDHTHKVFNRFYRIADGRNKGNPGLGIGLYISQEIIKRHHGRIWVESVEGEGSTFSFVLPIQKKA